MHKYQFLKADIEPWLKYSFIKKYGIPTKYVNAILNTNITNNLTTVRGKIKNFKLRGNMYQETTTGKNVIKLPNDASKTAYGLTLTIKDEEITINGTNTATSSFSLYNFLNNLPKLEIGKTYTFSMTNSFPGLYIQINYYKEGSSSQNWLTNIESHVGKVTFTVPDNYKGTAQIFIGVYNSVTSINKSFRLQLEEGTEQTDWEPYTGGIASPNPDYPQDIHVVSGNNKVIVSNKNLFNYENTTISSSYERVATKNSNGYLGGWAYIINLIKPIKAGTYYLSYKVENADNSTNAYMVFRNRNNRSLKSTNAHNNYNGVLTIAEDIYSIMVDNGKNAITTLIKNIQIEVGSTATDYVEHQEQEFPINLGNIELCKTTDGKYEDYIGKSTGKNLFSGIFRQGINTDLYATTRIYCDSNYYIEQGKTYTFSTNMNISSYRFGINISATELPSTPLIYDSGWKTQQSFTFTANVDGYLGVAISKIDNSNIIPSDISNYKFQLEEGNQATYYEPYGKKWYKYGAICKKIFIGNEEWVKENTGTENWFYALRYTTNFPINNDLLSNYYTKAHAISALNTTQGLSHIVGESQWFIRIRYGTEDTLENYKNWLSTYNLIDYYPLAIPEITEITDSNLISQLDAIENSMRSYKDQTNITVETNINTTFDLSYKTIDS